MGNQESMVISETSPRQIKITLPGKKSIIFVRGKRNTESEIFSDRDFFYFTLFRCLELYCWRYVKTNSDTKLNGSPRDDSPRLKRFDSVMEITALIRKNKIEQAQIEYVDKSTYKSELKEEILEVIKRIIGDYIISKDASKISLAIDTYVGDLKSDKLPHYVNYRPNLESDLSIALCFSLGFYKDWLSLPHSYLFQHEWEYLFKQNICLLDEIGNGKRYLDVLLDNDKRLQNGEISTNEKLSKYNYLSIYACLRQPEDKHKEYLQNLIKVLSFETGLVSQTVITWYYTFSK